MEPSTDTPGTDAQAQRKEFGSQERRVRVLAYVLWLASVYFALQVVMLAYGVVRADEGGAIINRPLIAILAVLCVLVVSVPTALAAWLVQLLLPIGKVFALLVAVPALFVFPIGTAIAVLTYGILLNSKTTTILSAKYRETIGAIRDLDFGVPRAVALLGALVVGVPTVVDLVDILSIEPGDLRSEQLQDAVQATPEADARDALPFEVEVAEASAPNGGTVKVAAWEDFRIRYDVPDEIRRLGPRKLERCVVSGADAEKQCLTWLAHLDRDRARRLYEEIDGKLDEDQDETRRSRLRWAVPWNQVQPLATIQNLEKEMKEVGLLAPDLSVSEAAPHPLTADQLLEWHHIRTRFDSETGVFPNEHHWLLAEIAATARGVLEDVQFEEVAPSIEEDRAGAPYTLRAYADGKRYEVKAENFGDWYDLGTTLSFINWLLEHRGSNLRARTLETGDQTADVIVAPDEAILEGHRRGWFEVVGAGAHVEGAREREAELIKAHVNDRASD